MPTLIPIIRRNLTRVARGRALTTIGGDWLGVPRRFYERLPWRIGDWFYRRRLMKAWAAWHKPRP